MLAARSGLLTKDATLGGLAYLAARLDTDAGRSWRPLEDTTDDPIVAQRRPKSWRSWQRSEDYYREGLLIWLDVDSLIRERSNGQLSLDDFARAFFGMKDRDWRELVRVADNYQRRRAHRFDATTSRALRVRVDATNGIDHARVFEIRAYA